MELTCATCGEKSQITDPADEALEEHRSYELVTRTNDDGNEETATVEHVTRGVTVKCPSCGNSTFHEHGGEG